MENDIVYAVMGRYDDGECANDYVMGIFSTKELAQKSCVLRDAHSVEEYTLDVFSDNVSDNPKVFEQYGWYVRIDIDGAKNPRRTDGARTYVEPIGLPVYGNGFEVLVYANDEIGALDKAKKIYAALTINSEDTLIPEQKTLTAKTFSEKRREFDERSRMYSAARQIVLDMLFDDVPA